MKKIFIIALLFIAIKSGAQTKIDFSGNWLINKTKTDFGHAPEWVLPKAFAIKQVAGKINETRTIIDNQLTEHPYTEVLAFEGTETETVIAFSTTKRKASLHWNNDGRTFILNSTSTDKDGNPGSKITETWSLEDDGKTLLIDRHVTQPNNTEYSIKAYYDKQ